ncbi:unnamed protein product [Protopolystoma xenopodis]|uniref:Ubiquitin carboxyl-terminal hydrolase 36 n=1 Tax=Protopolystoma xenopodis TaxID=117903 RepID=A0A3S5FFG8_9PLAT|nr:unnamed protein product [Protopolystoma xenopodis]
MSSLLAWHFTRPERLTGASACEACRQDTCRELRITFHRLSPHVLICLNLFTFNRSTKRCLKIMRRIRIPESLSVTVSADSGLTDWPEKMKSDHPSDPGCVEQVALISESTANRLPSESSSTPASFSFCSSSQTSLYSALLSSTDSSFQISGSTQFSSSLGCKTASHFKNNHASTSGRPQGEAKGDTVRRDYRLQGMIVHHGLSLSCGHYTCVTRVGSDWVAFDDALAHQTSLDQVASEPLCTPYLLLYSQV